MGASGGLQVVSSHGHQRPILRPKEKSEDDEICLGAVCEISVRLQKDLCPQSLRETWQKSFINNDYMPLNFRFDEKRCDLFALDEQPIATLNSSTFSALADKEELRALRYQGLMQPPVTDPQATAMQSRTVSIEFNVYGNRASADRCGTLLSQAGLFLQDPVWLPEGMSYYNPQDILIPKALEIENLEPDVEVFDTLDHEGDESESVSETDELDYDLLLSKIVKHTYLEQTPEHEKVSSKLLPDRHQKEGLNFLLRRESAQMPLSRSLWAEEADKSGEKQYRHAITGSISPRCDDIRGGILADEMGLGKTLTVLATIVCTKDVARSFTYDVIEKCGVDENRAIPASSTLVVLPSALLMHTWEEEIERHIDSGTITCTKYHGHRKEPLYSELLKHDIILTTYGTLMAENKRPYSLLHHIGWYRVVLDEAHVIRNASTKQFDAIDTLSSNIRWCLTGTPIQNTMDDLGTLVRFLKLPELGDPLLFRRHVTDKVQMKRSKIQRKSKVEPDLTSNIQNMDQKNPEFENLRLLLGAICLRRSKRVLKLSSIAEKKCNVEFSPSERAQYKQLGEECRNALRLGASGDKSGNAQQTVLEAILRLRLYCNNGSYFGPPEISSSLTLEEIGAILQQEGRALCALCSCDVVSFHELNRPGYGYLTSCRNLVCSECTSGYDQEYERLSFCPLCQSSHSRPAVGKGLVRKIRHHSNVDYPSKMKALRDNVVRNLNEGKSIVFSFWKETLDIVGDIFDRDGIKYLRVDGSISLGQRKEIFREFRKDPAKPVLLITFGTGAVGLNDLSVANQVHILEPQWNPAVESQAIGRIVRLDQLSNVQIMRYAVKNTVEERVLKRQSFKLQMARGGFTADSLDEFIGPDKVGQKACVNDGILDVET